MKTTNYCQNFGEKILKHYNFLFTEYNYELEFVAAQGRYNSDCVFGAFKNADMPKFQFGGETGPYVSVAPFDTSYSLLGEGGTKYPWIFVNRLVYLIENDRLGSPFENISDWDGRLEVLSSKTEKHFKKIINIFTSKHSFDEWIKTNQQKINKFNKALYPIFHPE